MSSQGQPTPPSSHSSTNGASPDGHNFRVVRKRNRIPLSCAPCRHRKLKCNRGHPCDNCTKRGDIASCSYATPGTRKRGGNAGANATPDDMQNRIDRLEGLVLSLMTAGAPGASAAAAQAAISASRSDSISTASGGKMDTPPIDMITEENEGDESELDNLSRGIGIMKMDGARTIFASDAHWYAILGEISEVKKYFDGHKEDYKQHMAKVQAARADSGSSGSFLLQGSASMTRAELLAQYPPKVDADRLIARYFNAYDPSIHIIHGPSFQKQYDRHWHNPSETSVHWLGVNFAMMTLALQSYHRAGDEPPEYRGRTQQLSNEYRRLTAQALLLADITQPIAQLLEIMVLHVQAEYGRSRDAEPSVLLLMSLCVRTAMRMGYHRDPAPHPAISPFQGEIRRRMWCFIRNFDALISFQFGLPAMIRTDLTDTQLPRNLYDDELHEDMKVLPPSRPVAEATPMSYMLTKSKMTRLFGNIVERCQSVTNPPTYEETMAFDQELRDARAQHPPLLAMRSFQESARDPANLIMQRLGLEMMFLRCLFVLHRRFITRGRENPKYAYSRRTCLDASLELLGHQSTLHEESQAGGRLRSVKWHISSMTTHDFLLAAMLVCSDLYHTAEGEGLKHRSSSTAAGSSSSSSASTPADSVVPELYDVGKREQMLRAVEHCITIWESIRDQSMEAYKGSVALRVTVEKIKMLHERQRLLAQNGSNPSTISSSNTGFVGVDNNGHYSLISPSNNSSASPSAASAAKINNAIGSGPFNGPRYQQNAPTMSLGMFPNGQLDVSQVKLDDLPPEQSAAMTLGLLSSGGMSPNPSFALNTSSNNMMQQQQQQQHANSNSNVDGRSNQYPASITALLNDPMADQQQHHQRSGLTPNYSGGNDQNAAANPGALSPLSQMFGQASGGAGGNFVGLDGLNGDIDWGAWDSYIQGTGNASYDPAQMWPMNMDLNMDSSQMPLTPGNSNNNNNNGPNSVFMGAPGAP